MRIDRLIAPLAAVAVLMLGQAARAELLIQVDKSAQRMTGHRLAAIRRTVRAQRLRRKVEARATRAAATE